MQPPACQGAGLSTLRALLASLLLLASAPSSGARLLLPGDVAEAAIEGGASHTFSAAAGAGETLRITLEQRGIDLLLQARAPGAELVSMDSPNGRHGREVLPLALPAGGEVEITVRSPAAEAAAGSYRLWAEVMPAATAGERRRILAELAMAEATRLRGSSDREDRRAALERYREVLAEWRELGERRRTAQTLHFMASTRGQFGEAEAAAALYEEALELWRRLGDEPMEAAATTALGLARLRLRKVDSALDLLARALEARRRLGDDFGQAQVHNNLGLVHQTRGEIASALGEYEEALELFRRSGAPAEAASALLNIGSSLRALGRHREAVGHYLEALEGKRRLGDLRGVAQALNNLGAAYREVGGGREALDYYGQALEIHRRLGDRRWEGRTLNNLGHAYLLFGDLERAQTLLRQALALRRESGDQRGEAITLNNLGRVHSALGEPGWALELHRRALGLHEEAGSEAGRANSLHLLGLALLEAERPREARERFEQALEAYRGTGDRRRQAAALEALGRLRLAAGERAEAAPLLAEALRAASEAGDLIAEALARSALAELELEAGRPEAAELHLAASLEIAESRRALVETPDLQAHVFGAHRESYALYVESLLEKHRASPAAGFDRRALELSERARARGLLELLERAEAEPPRVTPALAAERREARQRVRARARHRMELLARGAPAAEAGRAELRVVEALAELEGVEASIRRADPRFAALSAPDLPDAAAIQASLGEGAVLVEYLLGERRSFAWVVRAERLSLHELPPRRRLESAVRRLYEHWSTLDPGDRAEQRRAEDEVSRLLLAPLGDALAGRTLIVVPDGALHYLPFAALPLPGDSSRRPLLSRLEVAHAPSAAVWVRKGAARASRAGRGARIAVLADPVFGPSDPRLGDAGGAGEAAHPFDRLPATRREAEAVAALSGRSLVLTGFEASREAVVGGALQDYEILHLATHSVLDTRHPALSGLVLSLVDAGGEPRDGFLRLADLYRLRLDAELVVLSGCRTALGKEVRSEGLIGLAHGFFSAGAERLVASLWQVQDQATAELMQGLYRGLLGEGLGPAAALRAAQLEIAAERRWRDPFYWAAFVAVGAGS